MKHANLSIFVPHVGCPHRCSFCDQGKISGTQSLPSAETVRQLCREQAPRLAGRREAEIAFFGGSFTAVDRAYQEELLRAAAPFVESGDFSGIRVSTRPDAVDNEALRLLHAYHVTAVELGAQSMDDGVLNANRRGHLARDVVEGARKVREQGFSLGLQMMTGLYSSTPQKDLETAQRLADLHPDTVRVYPTIVLRRTRLAQLWAAGAYRPQDLEEAVELGARLLELFEEEHGIPVIRMGLHAQASLEQNYLAGPWHPAFRELCEGGVLRRRLKTALQSLPPGRYLLWMHPRSVSKLTGHGDRTLDRLGEQGYYIKIRPKEDLQRLELELEEV